MGHGAVWFDMACVACVHGVARNAAWRGAARRGAASRGIVRLDSRRGAGRCAPYPTLIILVEAVLVEKKPDCPERLLC